MRADGLTVRHTTSSSVSLARSIQPVDGPTDTSVRSASFAARTTVDLVEQISLRTVLDRIHVHQQPVCLHQSALIYTCNALYHSALPPRAVCACFACKFTHSCNEFVATHIRSIR